MVRHDTRYETVYGKKCYPGLEDLPEPAEVGVFVTGAEKTPALFEQFGIIGRVDRLGSPGESQIVTLGHRNHPA